MFPDLADGWIHKTWQISLHGKACIRTALLQSIQFGLVIVHLEYAGATRGPVQPWRPSGQRDHRGVAAGSDVIQLLLNLVLRQEPVGSL